MHHCAIDSINTTCANRNYENLYTLIGLERERSRIALCESDYVGGNFEVYFSGTPFNTVTNDSQCSNLFILDDNLVEGTEALILEVNSTDPDIQLMSPMTTTVFIMDEEGS